MSFNNQNFINKKWCIAMYVRLSKEDSKEGDYGGKNNSQRCLSDESLSIVNQKK